MIREQMPCVRDCAHRCAGCAVTCEKWRAYTEMRNREYEDRLRRKTAGAMTDGKRRTIRNLQIKERSRRR